METTATLSDPPSAVPPDDSLRPPLPGLVVGDTVLSTPRWHGWPGRLFIGLGFLTSFGCAVAAIALTCVAAAGLAAVGELWKPLVGASVWGVLQFRLSREVGRFSRWGWIGAMAELGGAALAKVALAVAMPVTAPSALVMLAINGAWMRYFWNRRAHYDIDLGG